MVQNLFCRSYGYGNSIKQWRLVECHMTSCARHVFVYFSVVSSVMSDVTQVTSKSSPSLGAWGGWLGLRFSVLRQNVTLATEFFSFFPQLSVKNCFIRGSVVRYVQLPADEVDTQLLQDAARKEASSQSKPWAASIYWRTRDFVTQHSLHLTQHSPSSHPSWFRMIEYLFYHLFTFPVCSNQHVHMVAIKS